MLLEKFFSEKIDGVMGVSILKNYGKIYTRPINLILRII